MQYNWNKRMQMWVILCIGIYYYICDKSGVYKRMICYNDDVFVVFFIINCKNLIIIYGFGCRC